MPSPFPGMDPYVEATGRWPSFHHALINACHDRLNDRLPAGYVATIDERVRLVSVDDEARWTGVPDVAVSHSSGATYRARSTPEAGAGVATLEPQTVTFPTEYVEARESYIEIIRLPERDLVTAVEVLSPANKNGDDRGDYLRKRRQTLRAGVNLVEIDLLLLGRRPEPEDELPTGGYYALVARADRQPLADVYAWPVRRPLPTIPVPLRPADGSVDLDLAAVFAQVYDRGRYAALIDYAAPPPVVLPDADRAWAAGVAATRHPG